MTDAAGDQADQIASLDCPRCAFAASHNFCASCGAELRPQHPGRRIAKAVFGPLAEYVALFPALVKPRWLVEEVEQDRIGIVDTIAFSLTAAGVAAAVTWAFPAEQAFPSLPPILSEFTEAGLAVGANALGNLPLAWALQRANPHRVPVRRFIALAMTLLALLYPVIALADGMLALLGIRGADFWTYLVSLGWYAIAYGRLYRRSWWKVLLWIAALWIGLIIAVTIMVVAIATLLVALGVSPPGR